MTQTRHILDLFSVLGTVTHMYTNKHFLFLFVPNVALVLYIFIALCKQTVIGTHLCSGSYINSLCVEGWGDRDSTSNCSLFCPFTSSINAKEIYSCVQELCEHLLHISP